MVFFTRTVKFVAVYTDHLTAGTDFSALTCTVMHNVTHTHAQTLSQTSVISSTDIKQTSSLFITHTQWKMCGVLSQTDRQRWQVTGDRWDEDDSYGMCHGRWVTGGCDLPVNISRLAASKPREIIHLHCTRVCRNSSVLTERCLGICTNTNFF